MRAIAAFITVIVALLIIVVLNLPPRQADMGAAIQLAQTGQITTLDLSGSTLTVTTNTERIRVEGVTSEAFDYLLTTANQTKPPTVTVSLSPDSLAKWRVYSSLLIPIVILITLGIGLGLYIRRTPRLNI